MPVNTASLKTFAPAMRRQLLEAVGRKLDLLLHSQTPDTLSTYAKQIAELREQEGGNRDQLLERVAYTWFNRLCALRYLDARSWHPFGCKVLMPAGEGETQPELLKLMRAGSLPAELKSHTNEARLHGLLDGQIQTAIPGADPQGEVFRELVLAICRHYHELLPNLFEGLDDASELLLPDDVLSEGSIACGFRHEISDDDCQDVEILGWLYQFYISEKKGEVMARKKAVPSEDIPAATQLFTPHWIVRYLVENSLGRLWLCSRPNSGLKQHMPYYVEDPEGQTPTDSLTVASPEEIKLLDPACGSGHMLTYAFDLLVKIWEEDGHPPSEIPDKILTNNLYGLEICPRAAQLAQFALVCKAREQSRTAFRRPVRPQVMCLQNVVISLEETQAWMRARGVKLSQEELTQIHQFRGNTETFGSLIQPVLDKKKLAAFFTKIGEQLPAGDLLVQSTHRKLRLVLAQALMLSQRYQVVVANPPYMGRAQMNLSLRDFVEDCWQSGKADSYAAFLLRNLLLIEGAGSIAMITIPNWLTADRFASFREELLNAGSIRSLVHCGRGLWGSDFGSCAFIVHSGNPTPSHGVFRRLFKKSGEVQTSQQIEANFFNTDEFPKHYANSRDFNCIPGTPISYWASRAVRDLFATLPTVETSLETREGLTTANNERFLRSWSEVPIGRILFGCDSPSKAKASGKRWFPYIKGGDFRRWYGNAEFVVNWENDGEEVRGNIEQKTGRVRSHNYNGEYAFRQGLTWSGISMGGFSVRFVPEGFKFDTKGPMGFSRRDCDLGYVAGFLNSTVTTQLLQLLAPTVDFKIGQVLNLPLAPPDGLLSTVSNRSRECIQLARTDWDNFETSWDFRDLPLLRPGDWDVEPDLVNGDLPTGGTWKGRTLAESWANYASYCTAAIRRMQELETENNRLWIDAYGLQDELDPAVPEDEITLACADTRKDIAAFLSYAVGCMMGRYSLDQPGLILADSRDSQAEQLAAYEEKVGKPLGQVQFKPDADAIIPVLDGEWFEDDIVARTREFLAVTFPESTVTENLRFIEESLGKDIRKYFCTEFYKDHLQTYKKRPIYWMVQSPKKGFSCLIYLHRYTKDTLNQVLNNYFRPYLQKLEARLAQLGLDQLNDDLPTRERTAARKEAEKITKVLKECQAWEQDALLPLAQQRIELDLDDGVKVNYLKLQDVLAPIPGLAAKED